MTIYFDASELLDTPERRAAYLRAALETGDSEEMRDAIGVVLSACQRVAVKAPT